jgi:hypothetical protein
LSTISVSNTNLHIWFNYQVLCDEVHLLLGRVNLVTWLDYYTIH